MSEQRLPNSMQYSELLSVAKDYERKMYCGKSGVEVDGSPYASIQGVLREDMVDFVFKVAKYLSNDEYPMVFIRSAVRARKEEEPLADPSCANWIVWTVFNLLGVSRVRKWEG